jgi:hypothetical protein
MSDLIALAGVLATAAVAIYGYLYTNRASRRERMSQTFAEALNAVGDYQDLPFRVRRRPSAAPDVRASLADRISDIHSRLDFHLAWLRITAPEVAIAYDHLVSVLREEVGVHIKSAWLDPVIKTDAEMNLGLGRQYQCPRTEVARDECVAVIQRHLSR